MEEKKFKLWLEFEEVDPSNWDFDDEFCNIAIELNDGRKYGINVWTYNFFKRAVEENKCSGENLCGLYIEPPDLFVEKMTRECISRTIVDLLNRGNLEDLLNPSIVVSNPVPRET